MELLFIANLAPSAPRGVVRHRDGEIGCNYRGRLACIQTLVDQAEYRKALYELNQLTDFIRSMKQAQTS
jgi:hypothetical protein